MRIGVIAVTAAVLVLLTANPTGATASRKTELTVSYRADAGYAAAVKLGCHPPRGGHPKKAQACRSLARAGGDPRRLAPAGGMCTMEYAPITAQVKGTWQGRRINWSHRYGNSCVMHRTTGVLTAF
jgi:hypothetical protein